MRYYRIEGVQRPYLCPPVGGAVCRPDQCVQYFLNVSAHSVSEVCDRLRELRFKGPIKRIQVFSRPVLKTDEDPDINYDCNELTNVPLPDCDDIFLEYDLLVTAGATTYPILTEDFGYLPSGSISTRIESEVVFNEWFYVAEGNISVGNEEDSGYFAGLVIVSGSGSLSFSEGATYSTNALGTQLVQAGATPLSLLIDVAFGLSTSGILRPPIETVDSICCGDLPSLLYMNHEMSRFAKLDKFLFINNLSLSRNIRLVYSAKKNIWYNNVHLKGTGVRNDLEAWNLTSEFGCIDDFDGIPIQGSMWGFSLTISNKNLRTGADNYTRIVLGFDPELICTLDRAIDSTFTVNTIDRTTDPIALRTVVLYDEIGLFKGQSFVADPTIEFRVTSTALSSPTNLVNFTNSLQELLL